MTFEQFRKTVVDYPVISRSLIKLITPGDKMMTVQLSRWKRSGKLVHLNKNFFILNEYDRKIHPSPFFLASELYKPSYLSLEYALSFHGLISERVANFTSISTKKTMTFINSFGTFNYRHLKTECFSGYSAERDEVGLQFNIALPEKALIDFLYLNLSKFNLIKNRYNSKTFLIESYRMQNMDTLDSKKLLFYAKLFKCKKLLAIVKEITE
jgi:hypothetical protein